MSADSRTTRGWIDDAENRTTVGLLDVAGVPSEVFCGDVLIWPQIEDRIAGYAYLAGAVQPIGHVQTAADPWTHVAAGLLARVHMTADVIIREC